MTSPSIRSTLLILAALVPLAAPSHAPAAEPSCHYVQIAKLPIRLAGDSLVPTISGQIDGAPATMLVDTGAYTNFLTRQGAEKRGITLRMSGHTAGGVGGETVVYNARLKDFSAGPAHSGKAVVPVLGEMGFAPPYDAIIGASFLLQMDLEIALADKQLKFFRQNDCGDAFLAYWDADAVDIPFSNSHGQDVRPHVTVEVNGTKMDAIIDTGAERSAIERNAAQRAGLKIDSPGVTRGADAVGAGAGRVATWNATFDTFSIGSETIRNAQIDIMDGQGAKSHEVLLGTDFLRAHRVLFAMSQQRLYLSYLGGDVFARRRDTIEPWIVREARSGNADAQFALARYYSGWRGVAEERAEAAHWLKTASDQGHPRANLMWGRSLMLAGRYPDAVKQLRRALDYLPAERTGALWLYLARLHEGDLAEAKRELDSRFRTEDTAWPAPVASFFLGRIDADTLLAQAGREASKAAAKTCEAATLIAEWQAAQGGNMPAAPRGGCPRTDQG